MTRLFNVIHLTDVDSTNTYLKQHPEMWNENLFTVQAASQSEGRGRYKRSWYSQPNLDLTFSTIFLSPVFIGDLTGFTLYPGLAVYRALCRYLDSELYLKWPNDICYGEKKIGGILCESVIGSEKPIVIIGIGLNVNSVEFPSKIKEKASSLRNITGREFDIQTVLFDILDQLKKILHNFTLPIPDKILAEWLSASHVLGKGLSYEDKGLKRSGKFHGINQDGSIIIMDPVTQRRINYKGEVVFDEDFQE